LSERRHVIALCGGVGGAKLAFGLTRLLDPADLTIVVNTGDDFEHLGFSISPDLDTVAYTLSDLADRVRGWGRVDETWNFMAALGAIGGEDWFSLGDRDLATHVERTRLLKAGANLSEVTTHLMRARGIVHPVVPMSDNPVRTMIVTDGGELAFQTYFVRERCAPVAKAIRYQGAAEAKPSAGFAALLARDDIAAIVLCPSNPYLSIEPILAIPGVRDALVALGAPIVAVSPIIGHAALKGPAAKLMDELGATPGSVGVVDHYRGLLNGLVIDPANTGDVKALTALGCPSLVTPSVMHTDQDRLRLAQETVAFSRGLDRRS
jgi:LPPG:FO 2-phospho-L-lactate transferase